MINGPTVIRLPATPQASSMLVWVPPIPTPSGTYLLSLNASTVDAAGVAVQTRQATTTIRIRAVAPVAVLPVSYMVASTTSPVTLDASGSYSPIGNGVLFTWRCAAGTTVSCPTLAPQATVQLNALPVGTYNFVVTTSSLGVTQTSSASVTVVVVAVPVVSAQVLVVSPQQVATRLQWNSPIAFRGVAQVTPITWSWSLTANTTQQTVVAVNMSTPGLLLSPTNTDTFVLQPSALPSWATSFLLTMTAVTP
jgi:hypothetical protein